MANVLNGRRPQDLINLVLAALLLVSPRVLGYAGDLTPTWNACLTAMVLGVLTIAALTNFAEWEEWVVAVIGLWAAVSPWILGFVANANAMWTHVVLGVLVALTAAWKLWVIRQQNTGATT